MIYGWTGSMPCPSNDTRNPHVCDTVTTYDPIRCDAFGCVNEARVHGELCDECQVIADESAPPLGVPAQAPSGFPGVPSPMTATASRPSNP